jgi:hypothetical protein
MPRSRAEDGSLAFLGSAPRPLPVQRAPAQAERRSLEFWGPSLKLLARLGSLKGGLDTFPAAGFGAALGVWTEAFVRRWSSGGTAKHHRAQSSQRLAPPKDWVIVNRRRITPLARTYTRDRRYLTGAAARHNEDF